MTKIFYPTTNLFPHQPQILHQMVLQFFVLADRYEDGFPKEELAHGMLMPYGSFFDTGLMQAAGYRYMLKSHKPEQVFIIAFADLPEDITFLGCDYDALHTFFGELTTDKKSYEGLDISIDNNLFAKHADPIICQLPFLRSYQKIDTIAPIIVNTKKTDLNRNDFWSAVYDKTGRSCYFLCVNLIDDMIRYATLGYEAISGEMLLSFESDQRTS